MCAVYFRTGIWGIGIGYSRSFYICCSCGLGGERRRKYESESEGLGMGMVKSRILLCEVEGRIKGCPGWLSRQIHLIPLYFSI